jgi:hydrogenase nickel incorporation protein HypB
MCATCGCNGAAPAGHDNGAGEHEHARGHEDAHRHVHRHPDGSFYEHAHGPATDHPAGGRAGGHDRSTTAVRLERDVLAKNAALAAQNRALFAARRLAVFNLTSSPGAGKTTLLEALIRRLRGALPLSVIEGDQETERDAERIRAAGARAVQINTGTGCHLDAAMVQAAVARLAPPRGSLLLVENVGNLVCPALFDLGERAKVVVMSVTEGEDKPLKYPHMFRAAQVLVLAKTDLLPHVGVDVPQLLAHAARVNPRLRVFQLSARTGEGLPAFADWMAGEVARPDFDPDVTPLLEPLA